MNRSQVLRLMGNMETAARDAAVSDGEKVSVTRDGTIRGRVVNVTYTWSLRKDGAGLERWTWRLDGKRINSMELVVLLETLPPAPATGAACKPGALIGRLILDACDSADAAMREARATGAKFTSVDVRNGHVHMGAGDTVSFRVAAERAAAQATPVVVNVSSVRPWQAAATDAIRSAAQRSAAQRNAPRFNVSPRFVSSWNAWIAARRTMTTLSQSTDCNAPSARSTARTSLAPVVSLSNYPETTMSVATIILIRRILLTQGVHAAVRAFRFFAGPLAEPQDFIILVMNKRPSAL